MQVTTATNSKVSGPTGGIDGRRAPVAPMGRLRRRPAMVFVFAALLLLGAVMGVVVLTGVTSSTEVVAVRSGVERGRVITEADLMVVRISVDPELSVVPAARLPELVGKRAAADLTAGTLIAAGQVTDQAIPATGTSVVGLALSPGLLPAEPLHAGDRVRVISTDAEVPSGATPAPAIAPVDATVLSVSGAGSDGQSIVVDVVVTATNAPAVAKAAANGKVALVLDSRER